MTDVERNILKECIVKAIDYLDKNGWDNTNNSRSGDLVYNGKLYPTKPILHNVAKQIESENLNISFSLSGGEAIFNFLEKLGFEIKRKNGISKIIKAYKKHIHVTQLKDESYKWALINEFKGRPDIDAIDLLEEFKSIKYNNLIYYNALTVINNVIKDKPEEVRLLLKMLFNENIDLSKRIKDFNDKFLKIYREINGKHQHHQDERTLACYLSFYNPEKYTFYKHSFYKKLCVLLNVREANKNEKYQHYLNLLNQIIEDYIQDDAILIDQVKSYIPEYYDGTNNLLLAQDILFQMLDKNDKNEYIDVKEQFIDWMIANDSDGRFYFSKQFGSNKERFQNEINSYETVYKEFFDTDLFIVDVSNIADTISALRTNIYDRNDGFSLYSKERANGRPMAILGKNNYLKFLKEQFMEDDFTSKNSQNDNLIKLPLNQILYGPPGTGKTFNSINKAIEIINPNFDLNQDRTLIKSEYERLVLENQIVFTTFHQSMSYEDFIEGIKPETKDGNVTYDVIPGLFLELCSKAESNWEDSKQGNKTQLSFEEAFLNLKEEWDENEEIRFPLKRDGNDFTILGFTKKSIQFKKASGGTGHTLSINTLKDYYYKKREVRPTGVGIYYPAILDKLNTYEPISITEKKLKNYVIIIDEINRGNVSAIFGELITLIEEDKRLGKHEALEVILPYSKEKFGVPPNVYIIGTMNTADRSVEALDTALRRRFSFVEMMPCEKVIEEKAFSDFDRVFIMQKINQRIELLLDRNYTLGHSYFIKSKFKKCFENEIIPLLQEYFYNDYGKIGLVLGKGFVREKAISTSNSVFADFETRNDIDVAKGYELIPFNEVNFNLAIESLLGN